MNLVKIYSDGRATPNPGIKRIAVVLESGEILVDESTGKGTNQEAEYEAVIKALETALKKGFKEVIIVFDSQLVYNQVWGTWKIKAKFWKYLQQLCALKKQFVNLQPECIPSEDNLAHRLVFGD